MKKKLILLPLLLLLGLLGPVSFAQELEIDKERTKVEFLFVHDSTSGTLGGFEAKINFNPEDFASSAISGSVDVKTLDTGVQGRDDHLKSADFFEAETYPKMTFTSSGFEKIKDGFKMTGIMKIKETEREEEIYFTFSNNVFTGKATINTADYGVTGNAEKGKVDLTFTIAVK